jgi:general nucleoside transport system permease protein
MSDSNPAGAGTNHPAQPAGPSPAAEPVAPAGPGPEQAGPEQPGQEQPEQPEQPSFGRTLINSIIEGNSAVVTILAIVAAVVIGGLLIAFTDPAVLRAWNSFFAAPGNAVAQAWDAAASAYSAMFEGAIFDPHTVAAAFHGGSISAVLSPLSETAVNATPLILAGLSVALAFRAGLFNIGATGQFIGGALVGTWLGFGVSLPPVIHVVVAVLGAFAGGAALGWIVGALKAWTGAHEVISTIMLNYVMIYFLAWVLGTTAMQRPGRTDLVSPFVAGNARLPHLFGASLRVNAGFILALAAAVAVWWLLTRSTAGFEFRAVGANPSAARTAGMSVERTWILVMLIAGGLAGLAACTVILGTDGALNFQTYGTYGFDAITVALLGRARPLGTVLAALLFGVLDAGGIQMQAATQTPVDIVTVISSLIVLFVAAPPLIRGMFRLREARARGAGQALAKGWNA